MSTQERVRTKVYRLARGKPLPLATFQSCGTPTSVRQAVSRLTKSGELVRVAQGVYARPKPVRFLKNSALPTPEAVAKAIAKQNHEELAPHGADVARRLGLSTQMTMQSAFYTTGRTRKVPLQRCTVAFEHAPKYLIEQQHTPEGAALLALYYLGARHITDEVLQRLRARIPAEAFARLDKQKLPRWLRPTITALEAPPRA